MKDIYAIADTTPVAEAASEKEPNIQLIRQLIDMQNLYLKQYQRANEYLHQRNVLEEEMRMQRHTIYLLRQSSEKQAKDMQMLKDEYCSSTSWKITAPVRAVSAMARRLFHSKRS